MVVSALLHANVLSLIAGYMGTCLQLYQINILISIHLDFILQINTNFIPYLGGFCVYIET